jgi:hypothetical protein
MFTGLFRLRRIGIWLVRHAAGLHGQRVRQQ